MRSAGLADDEVVMKVTLEEKKKENEDKSRGARNGTEFWLHIYVSETYAVSRADISINLAQFDNLFFIFSRGH